MVLGNGLLTSEGESHLRQRRMLQPAFHRRKVAAHASIMIEEADRFASGGETARRGDVGRRRGRTVVRVVTRALSTTSNWHCHGCVTYWLSYICSTQSKPTDGLKRLLGYYAGEGPTFDKLRAFICGDLVYDASGVTEDVLQERYASSIDPEVIASPPLRAPKDLETFKRLDFLLDARLPQLPHPTLVMWGIEDRVNPPTGAAALQQRMQACDTVLFSRTGHWVQWERADEFNAFVAGFLNAA